MRHPERYTCYDLGEDLVVGGGIGQLAAERGAAQDLLDAPAETSRAEQGLVETPASDDPMSGRIITEPERIVFRPSASAEGRNGAGNAVRSERPSRSLPPSTADEEQEEQEEEPTRQGPMAMDSNATNIRPARRKSYRTSTSLAE